MNDNNNDNNYKALRIMKLAVLLLTLCNAGLLATIWLRPAGGGGPHGPRGESPHDFVIRNLQFTDEQIKSYDELVKAHRAAMDKLGKEAADYREQLFGSLKNEHSGPGTDSLARLIAANQQQVELVTYNHFAQVRTLCNAKQKAEFDQIIGDVIKKMNGSGRHPGPPPSGPGGENGPPPQ